MAFFLEWWERWRQRNSIAVRRDDVAHTASEARPLAIGYRYGDAPTCEEIAAAAATWHVACEPRLLECGLTVAQHARLAELIDECGEVIHTAAKVLQYGYDARSAAGAGMSRRTHLERELGHLSAALSLLEDARDVRRGDVRVWKERRLGVRHAPPAAAPTPQQEKSAGQ